jgi:hypothetical protein
MLVLEWVVVVVFVLVCCFFVKRYVWDVLFGD